MTQQADRFPPECSTILAREAATPCELFGASSSAPVQVKDSLDAYAYLSGVYTMAEIGRHFAVRYMTASGAVRKFEHGHKKVQ